MGQLSGKVTLVRETDTGLLKLQVETPKQEVSAVYVMPTDELLKAMRALLIDGSDTLAKIHAILNLPEPETPKAASTDIDPGFAKPVPAPAMPPKGPEVLTG